jgi:hypothetical protein
MGVYKVTLGMANRSGGKTFAFAIIALLNTLANDNCESANLGAIQAQAQRCYRYMRQFIKRAPVFHGFVNGDPKMERTDFINGSSTEVLTATITGVNSPHPQKLIMDEIELIPWPILQEAFSMVQSKGEVRGTTVLGSTRKFAVGPMQRLIDEGRNIKLFSWCIWEAMKALPKDDVQLMERIRTEMADVLPKDWESLEFDGYYDWEDVLEKWATLDREIWDAQWECKKPDSQGLIYSNFDDSLNTELDFKLDKVNKQIYIWEDYGASRDHPDVLLFVQVDLYNQTITIFDEIYIHTNIGTDEIIRQAKEKLGGYGITIRDLSGWIGDPHGLTETQDRINEGLPILPPLQDGVDIPQDMVDQGMKVAQLYLIKNGIPSVRRFIGTRRLKITPKCQELRTEWLSYSRRKLQDGTFSSEPEKKNDHGPDACRYGIVRLFPLLVLGSFGGVTFDNVDNILPKSEDAKARDEEYLEPDDVDEGAYSAGVLNHVF